MRTMLRILIAATVASLSLAATAAAATAIEYRSFDVAVTGEIAPLDSGKPIPFTGTLQLRRFDAAPDGIEVEIAGITGDDGVIVAGKQQLALQNLVVLTDPKLGQEVLEFELPAVQTSGGGTLSLDPIQLTEGQLPAGADGKLRALADTLELGADTDAIAGLLDVSFGLIPPTAPA
jgi:hypothetical protein